MPITPRESKLPPDSGRPSLDLMYWRRTTTRQLVLARNVSLSAQEGFVLARFKKHFIYSSLKQCVYKICNIEQRIHIFIYTVVFLLNTRNTHSVEKLLKNDKIANIVHATIILSNSKHWSEHYCF